jgi:hypothetical protein
MLAAKDYHRHFTNVLVDLPFRLVDTGYGDPFMSYTDYFIEESQFPDLPQPAAGHTSDNALARAETTCLNNLRTGRALQLGADVIEGRKTLNMIAGATTTALRAYKAARSGQWGQLAPILGVDKPTKTAANNWLAWQYGWKPLLGTVHDGFEILRDGFRSGVPVYWAKGNGRDTEVWKTPLGTSGFREVKMNVACRSKVCYAIGNATTDLIDGMGLLNPLSVAWEAVPFSFVLDWFIPVGNVLSALTATAGLEYKDGYQSTRYNNEQLDFVDHWPEEPGNHRRLDTPGYRQLEEFRLHRRAYINFPRPQFYANAHPWNTGRVSNALALLRQLFR